MRAAAIFLGFAALGASASALAQKPSHARARGAGAPSASSLSSASASASASPSQTPEQLERMARADKRFHDAEKLFEEQRYPEACAAFGESQRLDPKLGTLLNVAYCHEAQGLAASAWREYSEAAAWASQQGRTDRVVFAQDRAAALAKNVARIDLQLPDDATLEIDGVAQPHAHFTAHVLVDAGSHKLRVSAPGKVAFEMDLAVPQGRWSRLVRVPSLIEEVTKPATPVASAAASSAPPPPPDDTKLVLAYTAGGIGAAALVVGTVFGARALAANGDAADHCTRDKCDASGSASVSDAKSFGTVSIVALAVGVLAIGGGGYLYFTSNPAEPKAVASRGARVSPVLGPRVAGIAVSGSF